jgi:hypothetical protein
MHWLAGHEPKGAIGSLCSWQVLQGGLDFVVDAACRSGLRLLLMLTNQWAAGGGMQQYVKWAGGGTFTSWLLRGCTRAHARVAVRP